jgi:hypothetical protein
MDAKRYCKLVLGIVLPALALVAAFNLLVDPLGAYPKVGLKKFERARDTRFTRVGRAELARRGHWQMAIFGTSRPKAGMPAEHLAFGTNRTCNLAVNAARMSETAAMFEYTRAHNPLRRALLCLDLAMFRDSAFEVFDFADSRFSTNLSLFNYHCKNLIGANITDQSLEAVTEMLQGHTPPAGERDGFHVRALKPGMSHRALFDKTLRSLAYGHAVQQTSTNQMRALRDVLVSSRDHEIDLTLAINPVHALDLELLVAGHAWPRFEQWKRDVVTMVAEVGATNVVVWDLGGYWEPATESVPPPGDSTTRMKFYFENSHYTPAMGALMLDRIFLGSTHDFGAKISSANIEAHLRRLQDQREAYARTHGADVEWVQRISMQALASRKKSVVPAEDTE